MIHFRLSLSWLILPLLASLSFLAIGEPLDGAAQALHLIGYIGADYPATVVDGQVVDVSEYQEQLEFLDVLQGLIIALPAQAGRAELEQGVSNLHQAITQRQSGDEVASAARALGARLAEFYQVSLTPVLTPDPQRGAPLYAQHCSVCHGDTGLGDGPAGIGLEPAPANLRDTARMDSLSLYDLYNTLGLGIEGTDMPAFADQLDERQRWDLASYIASFTATAAQGQARFAMSELAGRTPAEIAAAGGDVAAFRAQRAHPLLEQRGPQQLIGYTRDTLERSLQAYRDGDREQAYDLSVGAYLEGFELVESALDNLDAVQRKTTERALMAYRQALQDGAGVAQAAQALEQAKVELDKSAALLADGAMDDSLSFFASLLILLREGLEAILVLAAILAFLRNTG